MRGAYNTLLAPRGIRVLSYLQNRAASAVLKSNADPHEPEGDAIKALRVGVACVLNFAILRSPVRKAASCKAGRVRTTCVLACGRPSHDWFIRAFRLPDLYTDSSGRYPVATVIGSVLHGNPNHFNEGVRELHMYYATLTCTAPGGQRSVRG